jgi:3-phosphoshikimate 1-carboxyvinyltransferase
MRRVSNNQNFVDCTITLPLSKSIVNRLLIINRLSGGSAIAGLVPDSTDTVVMQQLLDKIRINSSNHESITEINVGNAGTVMRFLTALLAVTPGKWFITGTERMQNRPVKPLTDALQSLGADLSFDKISGYPPVQIIGNQQMRGGTVQLNAGISSQFISALMMLGPVLGGGIKIELQGEIISASYIRMTQALMQKAGADVAFLGNTVIIKEQKYSGIDYFSILEPDWSAAAFWYQVAAFTPDAHIILKGLRNESVQGDSVLPDIYSNLGISSVYTGKGILLTKSEQPAVREFNYDFTECPDLAQAVIVTCAALGIKGHFTGLKTLRVKETDRIDALRNELTKLGYGVDVVDNEIFLSGANFLNKRDHSPVVVKCYDDHRMAMSFATLAILREDICIEEPEVVKKSYPGFWSDLENAGIVIAKGV